MTRSLLERSAFALGVFTRTAVAAVAFPVQAAGRLLRRWGLGASAEPERKRLALPRPRAAPWLATPRVGSDLEVEARCRAARSAAELDGPEAARVLGELLHDTDAEVRCSAAEAAGRARASGLVFSLILALDDPVAAVRQAAQRALSRLTGRELELAAGGPDRQRQVEELKRWWKEQRLAALAGRLTEETDR